MENDAAVSFDALLGLALQERTRRELADLPDAETLARLYPDTEALDRRVLGRQPRRRMRATPKTLRMLAAVAAISILLAATTITAAAQVRRGTKNPGITWGEEYVTLSFELEGEPLDALPEDHGPHYIPDGFVLDEESLFQGINYSFRRYQCGEKEIQIECYLLESKFQIQMDDVHTEYNVISFQDETGYLGHWVPYENSTSPEAYTLIWAHDGVVYVATAGVNLTELMLIAESIY